MAGSGFLATRQSLTVRCEQAAWALSYFGPEAKEAVPDLIEFLRTSRNERGAVEALGRIGPDAATAIPLLSRVPSSKRAAHTLQGWGHSWATAGWRRLSSGSDVLPCRPSWTL